MPDAIVVGSGPNGLADWRPSPSNTGWLEEAGHLLSAAPSASLRKQIKIPEKAAIELAISCAERVRVPHSFSTTNAWPRFQLDAMIEPLT